MNSASMFFLGQDLGNRVVDLVTGEPTVAEPSQWWRIVPLLVALAAIAALIGLTIWRTRTSEFDAPERAFIALARRQGLDAGAKALIRRAAVAHGCLPVALLVSRHAMEQALASLPSSQPSELASVA